MKILLLGANGQVGWELQRSLAPLGQLKACDRQTANLEDLEQLQATVREFAPDIIVNAAAYTAVDKAETDADVAYRINAEAPSLLANEAKRLDAWLVHYSTDYVFDGAQSEAYTETDKPNPQSVYGASKLLGESAIRDSGCKHLIFRTSWVYAHRGGNFAKTMLRLASERDTLDIVADQFGVPTSAELIADITNLGLYRLTRDQKLAQHASGIYHLCPTGETSWHGFAQYVIAEAQARGMPLRTTADTIQPITTDQYPLPAKRPPSSRLNSQKIIETFDVHLPAWQAHVQRLIAELIPQD